jgi:ubiquinone biosynthesis protein UbiJ
VTHEYKLSEETLRLIHNTILALNEEYKEHQGVWDDFQTETWRGSDRGKAVAAWITSIKNLIDEMEELEEKA